MFLYLEQSIDTCVITVPPYFNQVERRALLYSASLAGLTVSQLMDDNTAGMQCTVSIVQPHYPIAVSVVQQQYALKKDVPQHGNFEPFLVYGTTVVESNST